VVGSVRWIPAVYVEQMTGDHLSGKAGNVRQFDSYQGNVRKFSGKSVVRKTVDS